jgi:hypothetical protein
MAVRPLRDGRYVVETDGGTYVVDLEARTCTCPDHAIRGARCKHLRRVAIEVTGGLVPAPDQRRATCAVCGRETFVPRTAAGPFVCPRHDRTPGDVVRDRETGSTLVVVARRPGRADRVDTDEGRLVADYPSNEGYGRHEPVFDCVYLADARLVGDAVDLADARRYSFPASRLRPRRDGREVRLERLNVEASADAGSADHGNATPRRSEPHAGSDAGTTQSSLVGSS